MSVDENTTIEALEKLRNEIASKLPTRSPIFLPTDRISLPEQIEGLKRVQAFYSADLDATERPKLRALREKYKGTKRCFVIGNGPSLNRTDLECLRNEVTFAVNGFFLKARELKWDPTFYVVEDHLVAEDRREWINAYIGPTKLFPGYLRYCIDAGPDTIFFNHRPRKSYPNGFDFSVAADAITYAGCTVTFTALQLAHYMGFEEIYLIGVDADYELPKDVEQSEAYGVGVLDMKSDDPNHFDPDYFGKGFRWHDPQVHKMVEAYQEARKVVDGTQQRIYNATVGGKLEVFERRAFSDLFPQARDGDQLDGLRQAREAERAAIEPQNWADTPRTLVFDLTRCGDGTATGEVKANLFEGFPQRDLMQVYWLGGGRLGMAEGPEGEGAPISGSDIVARIDAFAPEVIVYRPVPNAPELHDVAMATIKRLGVPLISWIMDDWPAELAQRDPQQFSRLGKDFVDLLNRSVLRLSICDAMSVAFKERYGVDFVALANGIDPGHWPRPRTRPPGTFKVRYAGSLARNMVLSSVLTCAQAVEKLARQGVDVRFEIKARPIWAREIRAELAGFTAVELIEANFSPSEYREWLSEGDLLLIAYNFEEESQEYTRYSLANKMPECLASGAPVLAVGPDTVATIAYLSDWQVASVVNTPDLDEVGRVIRDLMSSPFKRLDLAERAQAHAFKHLRLDDRRAVLNSLLVNASGGVFYPRAAGAHVDETKVVSVLLRDRVGSGHTLLDVGAHFGTSAAFFDKLGWRIHCFEPDPANRTKLVAKFGDNERVTIHDKAVSDKPAAGVQFFSSDESTGISGLQAFRETHRVTATVDVTTVSAVADEYSVTHVDFLKIDVEGFDFSVIRGVPWDRFSPDVIEAEFEDAKTIGLGYTYRDMCQYLVDRGYTVYVSEWHPIVRYGIRHQWCRVTKYPMDLLNQNSWGNILAFKQDPGMEAIQGAFEECLAFTKQVEAPPPKAMNTKKIAQKANNAPTQAQVSQAQVSQAHGSTTTSPRGSRLMMSNESLYTRFAMWAERRGGAIFALGQFAMHSLRLAKRQRALALAALVALVCLIGVAAWTTGLLQVLAFVGVAAVFIGAAVVAVVAYLSSQIHALNDNQRRELRRLQTSQSASLENLRKELRGLANTQDNARADLEKSVVGLIRGLEAQVVDHRAIIRQLEDNALKLANTESAQRQQFSKQLDENTKAIRSGLGANTNMYQRYGRVLSAQTADDLCKEWNQRLDTNFTRQQLAYLANRISSTEFSLNGRLATEVETQIVRTMSLLSIRKPSVRILEIGTLFGVAAACFYDASVGRYQSVDLTLLDPLDGYYGPGRGDVLTGELVNEIVLRRNLALAGVPNEAYTLVKALSTDTAAVEALRGQMFDFLLIDGDHTYQGVKNDFELYRSHVQPGGLILFDDYQTADWPDIAKYVDEEVQPRTDLVFLGASHRTAIFRAR